VLGGQRVAPVTVLHTQQPVVCSGAVSQYLKRRLEEPGSSRRVATLDAVAHHAHAELGHDGGVVVGGRGPAHCAASELVAEQNVARSSGGLRNEAQGQSQDSMCAKFSVWDHARMSSGEQIKYK
jgi:hypothetical protein